MSTSVGSRRVFLVFYHMTQEKWIETNFIDKSSISGIGKSSKLKKGFIKFANKLMSWIMSSETKRILLKMVNINSRIQKSTDIHKHWFVQVCAFLCNATPICISFRIPYCYIHENNRYFFKRFIYTTWSIYLPRNNTSVECIKSLMECIVELTGHLLPLHLILFSL